MVARSARDWLVWPRLRLSSLTLDYYIVGLGVAFSLGILVRAAQVLSADFPLNDGGLFYAMVRDLQANNYWLPAETTYNSAGIPYAYSPLAFYITAIVDDLTPFSLLTLFRFLPLVFSCLTLVAFWRLARVMLVSNLAVVAALAAFALIPRSFIWLIMGGGLTRALGVFFAILALEQVYRLYRQPNQRTLALAIVFSAATVLSHLQTGWFLAFSIALFALFLGRNQQGIRSSFYLAAGTAALTAPWWLTVVAYHGIDPFVAANSTGGTVFSNDANRVSVMLSIARAISTSEPFFPLIASLGLLGAVLCFATNRFLLPAWWVVIILLDIRAFATYASLPIGLLAGIAVAEGLLPLLRRGFRQERLSESGQWVPVAAENTSLRNIAVHAKPLFLLGCLLYYAAFAATVKQPGLGELTSLDALDPGQRQVMEWISTSTPPDATFLVIPSSPWETGKDLEWFPVLAHRPSVATVQGTEWLRDAFSSRINDYYGAWGCAFGSVRCIERWEESSGLTFTHLYLPTNNGNPCCSTLDASLRSDPNYRLVYEGAGGVVFERRD